MASTPERVFQVVNGYQAGRALEAAVRLDLFSHLGDERLTSGELATKMGASERGTRILCDFLVVVGFLRKEESSYRQTRESATFLDRASPAYVGSILEFMLAPQMVDAFQDLDQAVRRGGTIMGPEGTMAPEHPLWIKYARAMAPLRSPVARFMTELVGFPEDQPLRVLDIAAGHGIFGITFARRFPRAEIHAVDWAPVLEVAVEHARAAGVEKRFHRIPGSAFEVDYGTGFDIVLATNFFHHFDPPTCDTLIRRMTEAMQPQGVLLTLEYVPDENRVTPPPAASFPLILLATTERGDAYTLAEYEEMFRAAGLSRNELFSPPGGPHRVIRSRRA